MKKPILTLDAALVQDDLPLEVIAKLFVGSIHAAFNLDSLTANGVTHILNASRLPPTFPKQFTYLSVEIRDKDGSNILSCIPTTNIFIEAGLDHGGVLVHCFGGKSRSPAFIAAYLMSSCNWGFDEAYRAIKLARPAVEINLGFEYQLRAYAAAKYDVYIAQQLLLRARIRELHFIRGDSSVVSCEANISDQLNMSKLSTAHLLGNQRHLLERLDQITAKNQADLAAAQQKGGDERDRLSRNKRSFEGLGEEDSSMDIDATDGDDSTMRSPCPAGVDHKQGRFDLEESQDSLISVISGDSVARQAKMPKERYGEDVIKTGGPQDERDRDSEPTGAAFHVGAQEASLGSVRKSKSSRPNHGARGSSGVEAKNPSCRLSCPGSSVVRVIPPLRGLEREVKCSWCNAALFQLASVLRTDVPMVAMLEEFLGSLQSCAPDHRRERDDGPDPEDTYLAEQTSQHQPPTMRGGMRGDARGGFSDHSDEEPSPPQKRPLPPIHSSPPDIYLDSSALRLSPAIDEGEASGVPTSSNSYVADGNEMEVEAEDFPTPFVVPLKTSRAGKQPAGFSFDLPDIASGAVAPPHSSKAAAGLRGVHFPANLSPRPSSSSSSSGGGSLQQPAQDHCPPSKPSPRALLPTLERRDLRQTSTSAAETLMQAPGLPNSARLEPLPAGKSSPPKPFFAALYPGLNPPSHGRLCVDVSPRVLVPPHRQLPVTVPSSSSSSSCSGPPATGLHSAPFMGRPASAEKRRWLARVSLLRDGSDRKVLQLADQDDGMARLLASDDEEKYVYVEYLDWMGKDVFASARNYGDISCSTCKRVIGCWNWTPSNRLLRDGHMEAPLFLIHKNVVQHADVDFDATPSGTPRVPEDFEGAPS